MFLKLIYFTDNYLLAKKIVEWSNISKAMVVKTLAEGKKRQKYATLCMSSAFISRNIKNVNG